MSKKVIADDGRFIEPGRFYQGKYYPEPDKRVIAEDGRSIGSGRWYQGKYYPDPKKER